MKSVLHHKARIERRISEALYVIVKFYIGYRPISNPETFSVVAKSSLCQ